MERTANNRQANSLYDRVAWVKSEASCGHGRSPSEDFRKIIANKDKIRCIGTIAFEDIWTGANGWTSPDALWSMAIYVWRLAPEFFEAYDPDRIIEEDSSKWSQCYFDDQRNFLRHNFCLERLCHLVMVYEFLHGAEARNNGVPPSGEFPRPKVTPPPRSTSGEPKVTPPPRSTSGVPLSLFILVLVFAFGMLVAVAVLGIKNADLAEKLQRAEKSENGAIRSEQEVRAEMKRLSGKLQRAEEEEQLSAKRIKELEEELERLKAGSKPSEESEPESGS